MCPVILNFATPVGLHKIVSLLLRVNASIILQNWFLFCCPDVPTFLWFLGALEKGRGGKADSQVNSQNILKLINAVC